MQLMLLFMTALLSKPGLAGERSIMTGAVATMSDRYAPSESAASQIGLGFKSYLHSTNEPSPYPNYSKWYRIELPKPETVVTAHVINECFSSLTRSRFG